MFYFQFVLKPVVSLRCYWLLRKGVREAGWGKRILLNVGVHSSLEMNFRVILIIERRPQLFLRKTGTCFWDELHECVKFSRTPPFPELQSSRTSDPQRFSMLCFGFLFFLGCKAEGLISMWVFLWCAYLNSPPIPELFEVPLWFVLIPCLICYQALQCLCRKAPRWKTSFVESSGGDSCPGQDTRGWAGICRAGSRSPTALVKESAVSFHGFPTRSVMSASRTQVIPKLFFGFSDIVQLTQKRFRCSKIEKVI